MLREPELKTGSQKRGERSEFAITGDPVVVEPNRHVCARLETLIVGKVRRAGILRHNRRATEQTGRQYVRVIVLQRSGDNWIEAGDDGSNAQRRTDQAARACACSARSSGSSARAGAIRSRAQAADTAARRALHNSGWHAKDR